MKMIDRVMDKVLEAFGEDTAGTVCERFEGQADLAEGVSGRLKVDTEFENNRRPCEVTPRNER